MVGETRFPRGILVTCVVPWTAHGELDEDRFRSELRRLLALGFHQIYIFGTAGEGHAVDNSRFRDVVAVFHNETRGEGILPQVGVISLSTANVIERLRIAYDAGFRIFQISLPSWIEVNLREMLTFFQDVCSAFPDCQFLHYNLARARRVLTGADYRRIADRVPNLVATKITSAEVGKAVDIMQSAPELQHFFVQLFPFAAMLGNCSLLGMWGPMCPSRTRQLFECVVEGRMDEAFRLYCDFLRMDRDVLAPARPYPLSDGAYDKLRVRLGGVADFPLNLLSPYEGYSEGIAAQCVEIMRTRYAGWEA